MRRLLAVLSALAVPIPLVLFIACAIPLPIVFTVAVSVSEGEPSVAVARIDSTQALVGGEVFVEVALQLPYAAGARLYYAATGADTIRYVTFDGAIDETLPWGEPVHPRAASLFAPGEAEAVGITFRTTDPVGLPPVGLLPEGEADTDP